MIHQGRTERIALACDEKGQPLKQKAIELLTAVQFPVSVADFGCFDADCDEEAAVTVAKAVSSQAAARGIVIGANTMGLSLLANKFLRVRSVVVRSTFEAAFARRQFDANVICLRPSASELEPILSIWLTTPFDDEDGERISRHARRVAKIAALEESLAPPSRPPQILPHFPPASVAHAPQGNESAGLS